MHNKIDSLLDKYLAEAETYKVTDTAPSVLRRGEATSCDYYILKVDLCDSTRFLMQKQHSTYLRLAHTYLSTIDQITQAYGAESSQVEYAGDGIIAYFPCDDVEAVDVLLAAYYCRYAASRMKGRHATFKGYEFKTKVMLHQAKLILAKIGPWGGTRVTAIGSGLHIACKLEKHVPAGEGRATLKFGEALQKRFSRFLGGDYEEELVPVIPPPTTPNRTLSRPSGFSLTLRDALDANSTPSPTLLGAAIAQPAPRRGLLAEFLVQPGRRSLSSIAESLYGGSSVATPAQTIEKKSRLVRHRVVWGAIEMFERGVLKL